METLDKVFENVCELDLIFSSEKVNHVLDEIIMGGLVLETNTSEVIAAIDAMQKLEKQSMQAMVGGKVNTGQSASGSKF